MSNLIEALSGQTVSVDLNRAAIAEINHLRATERFRAVFSHMAESYREAIDKHLRDKGE